MSVDTVELAVELILALVDATVVFVYSSREATFVSKVAAAPKAKILPYETVLVWTVIEAYARKFP